MNKLKKSGVYLYQGNSIVVPENTPDSLLSKEVNSELANVFNDTENIDRFSVPSLDGQEDIESIIIPEGELPPGWKAIPFRQALSIMTGGTMAKGQGPVGRILRSYHAGTWRKESRFCGSCGGKNSDADSGELARQCNVCGRIEFPRISPAVITIIVNDNDEIVLAHNHKFTSGIYSIIAGFNEPGECFEETVLREAKEEINLALKDIRYVCSQPWPFPNSVMLGFSARHAGGELRPDGIEIDDARWFSRENLPKLPPSASVSRYLIDLWFSGKL